MTAAVLKLVRTHREDGTTPLASTQGLTGTGTCVQLVGLLLRDGAQSAYPTELARHRARRTASHWLGGVSFGRMMQEKRGNYLTLS